ncbi:FtsQ-type POTRA domain-containing protein [Microbacterium sp. MC2]
MRRPGPLPAPPPRREPAAPAPDAADEATYDDTEHAFDDAERAFDDAGRAFDEADHDPAPGPHDPVPEFIDTIGPMARRPAATIADPPAHARRTAPPADDPAQETVGPREVWAAVRARRKALRAEVRRFTARQRRKRRIWLGAGLAVAALVLGTLGAAYSPLFAVERVRVLGTEALDTVAVEEALAAQLGTPLPLVDSSEVKAALVAFPLVESYTLEARPPHELVVRIVERTPVGAIESAAGYTLVDAAGVALATTPEEPEGHPLLEIRGGVTSRAFTAAGTVFRSLPEPIRSQVTKLSATTASDVSFVLGESGTTVVWGTADESARKAIVLETAMEALPPDDVDTYDVSSPGAIVVR